MNRSPLSPELDGPDASGSDTSAAERQERREAASEGEAEGEAEEDGDFGDDFDEFEEGGEGDDFGDFDDGFQGEEQAETAFEKPLDQTSIPAPPPGPVSQRYTIPDIFMLRNVRMQ